MILVCGSPRCHTSNEESSITPEFVERHRRLTHPGRHESPNIGRINEAAISVWIAAAKSSPAEARARIRRSLLNPDVVRRERAWPP